MIWLISQSNPQLSKRFNVEHEICFSEQVCLTEPNMGQNYLKLTLALPTVSTGSMLMNYYVRKHWPLQRTKEERYGNTREIQSSKINRLFFLLLLLFLFLFLSGAFTFPRCIGRFGKCVFLSLIFIGLAHNALLYSIIYMKQNLTINEKYSFFQALENTTCLIEWMLLLEASLKDYRCYEQECVHLSIFQWIRLQLQFPLSPLLSVSLSITSLARFS